MDDNKWLESLKLDDTVLIYSGRRDIPYTFARVTKITKAKITVTVRYTSGKSVEYIFNKSGWQVTSDRWNKAQLCEPTQERRDEIVLHRVRVKVRDMLENIVIPNTIEELLILKNTLEPFIKKENTDVDQKSL